MLLVSAFLVVASGLALLWTFPGFLVLHVFAALFWLPIVAIHAVARAPRIPRLVADDWVTPLAERTPGRDLRLGVMFAAVVVGVIAAILVQPTAAPMIAWSNTVAFGPGPFIVGIVISVVGLIVARPLRWS